MRLKIFSSRPSFGEVASAASHDIGARNAIEIFQVDQALEMLRVPQVTILVRALRLKIFWSRPRLEMLRVPLVTILAREMRLKFFEVDQRLEMLRVPLVTILAREMRLKFFEVDQALKMLRVPLVTILAREMRLKNFWSRPSFGDVASAASHDIGARNAIENFFQVDQALKVLRVPLVTILAREMRLKIFWSRPNFGDVASAASHDIGARNAIEIFEVDQALEMLRVPLVTILAREMRLKIFWSFLKLAKLWRCCECR